MKNVFKKSISVLLVLAMLISIPAFAVGSEDTSYINTSSTEILTEELYTEEIELTPSDTDTEADDVYELTSLRERNVKHIYGRRKIYRSRICK